jgi:hypothetical protein
VRIAYRNLLETANLSTTSEHTSYPLTNILHRWKRRVYRTQQGVSTAIITAIFDEVSLVRSFFIVYHNCNDIQVRFYDDNDDLLDTWNVDRGSYHDEIEVKKVEIELTSPTDLYVGNIFIGSSLFFNKESDQDIPLTSSDVATFSSDFQVSGREGSIIREGTIVIPALSIKERKQIEEVFYSCGLIKPFYLDLWDKSPEAFDVVFGVFTTELGVRHLEEGDTVSFGFREVN